MICRTELLTVTIAIQFNYYFNQKTITSVSLIVLIVSSHCHLQPSLVREKIVHHYNLARPLRSEIIQIYKFSKSHL